jgi:hypothetical protein
LKAHTEGLDLLLLFDYDRSLFLQFALLFQERFVLFEKLVEQHRIHLVVTHAVEFAFLVACHQVRIYVGDFLGDQTKSRAALFVVLVVEGHWFERQDGFAGFVHWFDIVLEASGRGQGAHLSIDVNGHGEVVRIKRFLENEADIATVGHVDASNTDTNLVAGCNHIGTGVDAQGDVVVARSVVSERANTYSRVVRAGLIELERHNTCSGIIVAVAAKRRLPGSGVVVAGGVAKKCTTARGRVVDATRVAKERKAPSRGVAVGGRVTLERTTTIGRVVVPGSIAFERVGTAGRVLGANRVAKKGEYSVSGIEASDVV